jgi:hypothetical protein
MIHAADAVINDPSRSEARAQRSRAWRGLLWREGLQHGGLLERAAAAWLIVVWVLALDHPGWLFAFGALFALRAGEALGGAEAAEGVEEFAFALPPTRSERFLARLGLGLAALLGFQLAGLAAIAADAPQLLWRLVADSGLTETDRTPLTVAICLMIVVAPLAGFAVSFSWAACSRSVRSARSASVVGFLVAGTAAGGALFLERQWYLPAGSLSVPAMVKVAVVAGAMGWWRYVRKDGIASEGAARGRIVLPTLVLIALALLVLVALAVPRTMHASVESGRAEAVKARTAAIEAALEHYKGDH